MATSPTPKKPSNAKSAARWPNKALAVLENTLARLHDIGHYASAVDRHSTHIDTLAARCVDAIRDGNSLLAVQLAQDIRTAAANQRHACASIRTKAGESTTALAAARVGEYGEG